MGIHADDAIDMAIDYMIAESEHNIRIENWNKWIHTDQFKKEYKIKDMTNNHIKNTIKFFEIYDTSHNLYKELNNRWINWRIIK